MICHWENKQKVLRPQNYIYFVASLTNLTINIIRNIYNIKYTVDVGFQKLLEYLLKKYYRNYLILVPSSILININGFTPAKRRWIRKMKNCSAVKETRKLSIYHCRYVLETNSKDIDKTFTFVPSNIFDAQNPFRKQNNILRTKTLLVVNSLLYSYDFIR